MKEMIIAHLAQLIEAGGAEKIAEGFFTLLVCYAFHTIAIILLAIFKEGRR